VKILFIASEMTPIAKVGGLGDVIGSLPKALRALGVDVSVVLPRYECILKTGLTRAGEIGEGTTLFQTEESGVPVFLVENEEKLGRGPIYFEKTAFAGSKKEIDRFVFFSEMVAAALEKQLLQADIVHAHDWHTARLVALLSWKQARERTVFTIHNLANQGTVGGGDLMLEGIESAGIVTTVSETYAREIQTVEYGDGLEKILQARAARGELLGIVNGIDTDFWNPATDKFLTESFGGDVASAKAENKRALQRELGLAENPDAPLFGIVARLTEQKGIDLVTESLQATFLERGASQFVFLGQGQREYEAEISALTKEFPRRVAARIGFDEGLAHRIYASSDFFLMPSRFEPCGLGQMVAMRYGAIPIVRNTGGLRDTVKDGVTGFVFNEPTSSALVEALDRALELIEKKPQEFNAVRNACLAEDWSWKKSARAYRALYEKIFN
jgi:starch synthase